MIELIVGTALGYQATFVQGHFDMVKVRFEFVEKSRGFFSGQRILEYVEISERGQYRLFIIQLGIGMLVSQARMDSACGLWVHGRMIYCSYEFTQANSLSHSACPRCLS